MISIGQKVKDIRIAEGMSQDELAIKLGITRPTYTAIENGKKEPTISELRTICEALGTTLEKFLFSSTQSQPYEGKMDKFKQIILNCLFTSISLGLVEQQRVSNTKLAALIYLLDFAWYYENKQPMSGLSYRQTKRGPVVDAFYRMLNDLYDEGTITFEFDGRIIFIRLIELTNPPQSLLSPKEKEFINLLCSNWKDKSTREIIDFAKTISSYTGHSDGEIVPYESITAHPQNPIISTR